MVANRLADPDTSAGFLLDGYPRTVTQAEWLADLLGKQEERIDAVIVLSASDRQLMERLFLRGRKDDTSEVIQHRLQIYHDEAKPLLDYYLVVLVPVDGDNEINDVQQRMRDALKPRLNNAGEIDSAQANR